jgi:phosphatidylinositol alpha-1,6-mannosyltransferase
VKKILLISSEFPPGPGGIGFHAYSLSREFQKNDDFRLSILCNADYILAEKVKTFDKNSGLNIIRFKRFGKFTQIIRVIQFLSVIQRIKPDIIIFSGLFSLWLMNLVFTRKKNKIIAIIHGHEPIFGNLIKQRLTVASLKKADHFIAVSRFSKLTLENKYQLTPKQSTSIIPNGIDPDYLESWQSSIGLSSKPYNLKAGYPKLLTIGHTSPRKGQHNVILALPAIMRLYPQVMYYIVGRDVNNSGLIETAKTLGVSENIQFVPPTLEHFELFQFYQSADIFMLLSENQPNGDVEGFGIVALESNYFGVPVIGAQGCGVEDAVSDGYSGFLVNAHDGVEISDSVNNIIQNYNQFSLNAKEFANQHKWSNIVKQFETIICAE